MAAAAAPGEGRGGLTRAADRARGRRAREAAAEGPALEVTSITVVPADDAPLDGSTDGTEGTSGAEGTAADWLPGIRDEHDDDDGPTPRWQDRPTWDRTVTPNIRRRTGARPARRR